jgi:hypothetical protein
MTVPLNDDEFERLFQEGDAVYRRFREALKNNPHKPPPWEDITPPQLQPAIKHLNRQFGSKKFELSLRVECGCYLGLHPHLVLGPKFKGGSDNLVPAKDRIEWQKKYTGRRESDTFKFWSEQFSESLAELIVEPFNAFLQIGITQKSVLNMAPIEWAKTLTDDLIYGLEFNVPHLIKDMCDQKENRPDKITTENLLSHCAWVYWRAPKFVRMEPSGHTLFDPATAWEREDAETTERLLQSLTRRMLDIARLKLTQLVGETHVSMAATSPLPASPAEGDISEDVARGPHRNRETGLASSLPRELNKPESSGGSEETERLPREFDPSEDYRHIKFKGVPYSLTRKQAEVVKILHQAAKSGHPDVGKDRLLSRIESETSGMRSIFKNHPLWQTLITSASKGTYRLNISEAGQVPQNTR